MLSPRAAKRGLRRSRTHAVIYLSLVVVQMRKGKHTVHGLALLFQNALTFRDKVVELLIRALNGANLIVFIEEIAM